jgi:hypothetical protein
MSDIVDLANMARLAYKGTDFFKGTTDKEKLKLRLNQAGFDEIQIIVVDDLLAYITRKNGKTYLIFRGSSNLENWIRNADIGTTKTNEGKVYEGFYRAHKKLLNEVVACLNKSDNIYVAGHSLGSAISQLTANTLYKLGYNIVCCVGIGSPRIGKKKYIENTKWFPRLEILHGNDLVTELPPKWLSWCHYDKIYITDTGLIKDNTSYFVRKLYRLRKIFKTKSVSGWAEDHSSIKYCEELEKHEALLEKVFEVWR